MNQQAAPQPEANKTRLKEAGVYLLLVLVLAAGAFFRFSGIMWGEYQYLHPDERFLVWVGSDISPVDSFSEYFDTTNSSLNPHNVGHGFYVYGTFPMFLARYAVEWIFQHSGFDVMTQVGRVLSAVMDLVVVLLVFMTAKELYDRRVAILAAAFSAASVLQIQQSHFFTMDTFMNAFMLLAFYFSVLVAKHPATPAVLEGQGLESENAVPVGEDPRRVDSPRASLVGRIRGVLGNPLFWPSLGFGIALGLGASSKLDAAPMALALPAAMALRGLKLQAERRASFGLQALGYLCMAALVSLVVFRLFQPYAFSGPGFAGIIPNEKWLNNIRELVNQGSGDVDFPPAMQWARRPAWFSFQNIVLWGLGIPFGVLAWTGFAWIGWRILRDFKSRSQEWTSHVLIWGWTAFYFTWQSMRLNPTLRYQLPIYPMLAIFAGWAAIALFESARKASRSGRNKNSRFIRAAPLLTIVTAGAVLAATFGYAYAFSRIYVRPITRIAASRWIYQNIPGPINLLIQAGEGPVNQPIPFPYDRSISPGVPYSYIFTPREAGLLEEVNLPRVIEQTGTDQPIELVFSLYSSATPEEAIASETIRQVMSTGEYGEPVSLQFKLSQPVALAGEASYRLQFEIPGQAAALAIDTPIQVTVQPAEADPLNQPFEMPLEAEPAIVRPDAALQAEFSAPVDGYLTRLKLGGISSQQGELSLQELRATLQLADDFSDPQVAGLQAREQLPDGSYAFDLLQPLSIAVEEKYEFSIEIWPEGGKIALRGFPVANEGEWDDGLPLRLDGYDGFGGIFPLNLDFNMYWDDNPEKLRRFLRILDQSEYIFISSNRQWGTLPRIPERFPLTSAYYRHLLGCPLEMEILDCYRVARPGTFQGQLGFELVQTFQSDPQLGPFRINDQFAEEAFTVYDHPKVLIFRKSAAYEAGKVEQLLGDVDLTRIIRMPPMRYPDNPSDLMLPLKRWVEQQEGGTWSEIFDSQALHNRFQPLGVAVWYLALSILGLACYPLLRLAFPGLADNAYPLARTAGLLVLSYLVWLAGSFRIPFTRQTITMVFIALLIVGGVLAFRQRKAIAAELRQNGRYFLLVEGLTLAFFLAFLLVRLGNPDLWHPWKGGEKPMDFSYFNAVLKSSSFPPYDPWYAGGYLNYYYYGFVLAGVLTKWLGIVPAFAYNLILPTLFSLIGMGAFSIVWNLVSYKARQPGVFESEPDTPEMSRLSSGKVIPAIAASFGMAVLGNLGTVRMIFQGFQKIAAPEGNLAGANLFQQWAWALQGFIKTLQGAHLPYGIGDWYWNPSRIIPAPGEIEPITEFPYFTVLYGDPHAHLFALPVALFGLAGITGIVLGGGKTRSWLGGCLALLLTALAVGALKPTNTWDFYPYLVLGMLGVGMAAWQGSKTPGQWARAIPVLDALPPSVLRASWTVINVLFFAGLCFLLFQPYEQWYALGYSEVEIWKGTHTPLSAYLTHWGLFLFLILTWMVQESLDWMASTPASALRKLLPYRSLVLVAMVVLAVLVVILTWQGVGIAWLTLPLMAWAGLLLLRPGMPINKQIVLFLTGTGLALTLTVELIVLRGDIGRMNTVFKFYLQVWTLFSISAAASFGWLAASMPAWSLRSRSAWQLVAVMLLAGSALYPLTATLAKIRDRMTAQAPHTLNGMEYMKYSTYTEEWGEMDLSQDYEAIRWMQENISGSPVIVEANLRDLYRWGSRYTIYTGLPGVVGWEWHQQQQRAVIPGDWISRRIDEIADFYQTSDWEAARKFLEKYNVQYIVVGQQERGKYPGAGLDKFAEAEGNLWREVFRSAETVIYQVIDSSEE